MKNNLADGLTITVKAPKKVVAGDLVVSENVCGVAVNDAESGADCVLSLNGVYTFPLSSGSVNAAGKPVYLTSAAGKVGHSGTEFTFTSGSNTLIGYLWRPSTGASKSIAVLVRSFIPVTA